MAEICEHAIKVWFHDQGSEKNFEIACVLWSSQVPFKGFWEYPQQLKIQSWAFYYYVRVIKYVLWHIRMLETYWKILCENLQSYFGDF